jgi:hypothetical protein
MIITDFELYKRESPWRQSEVHEDKRNGCNKSNHPA